MADVQTTGARTADARPADMRTADARPHVARDASALVAYAIDRDLIDVSDRIWAYNAILATVGAVGPAPVETVVRADDVAGDAADDVAGRADQADAADGAFDLQATLARLSEVARGNGVGAPVAVGGPSGTAPAGVDPCDDGLGIPTQLMGLLMPRPSEVARRFRDLMGVSPRRATDWFYRLCCDADYVRRAAIARDIRWVTPTRWGELEMTINRSKPEKDPRAIAAAGRARTAGPAAGADGADGAPYPACPLCVENEGYAGRSTGRAAGAQAKGHPARQNLRIVPLDLGGHPYGMQYSPYAYYGEHCIVMNRRHVPMRVDRGCLERLLDFVDLLPHYFVGSNAGLPIVGGSILAHDHFQGGRHVFPMDKAPDDQAFALPGSPDVRASVVRWPLTVIRLRATDRAALVRAAAHVMDVWQAHDAPEVGVIARGDRAGDATGVPHNAVTPIVRHVEPGADALLPDGGYVMRLALRCNVTTPDRPLGLFHPRPELHHIKRENIGLIEVMGLAVLPARLARELGAVADVLTGAGGDLRARLETGELTARHASWALDVAARHPELDATNVRDVLRDEVGQAFSLVLEDAGVFKWDEAGRAALGRFIERL